MMIPRGGGAHFSWQSLLWPRSGRGVEQMEFLTDQRSELAFVDRGYRGHGVETIQVLISGSKRGLTPTLKKLLRRTVYHRI